MKTLVSLLLLSTLPLVAQPMEPLKIPRAEGIIVDGHTLDWEGKPAYRSGPLVNRQGRVPAADDLAVELSLAWDEAGLLLGAQVLDSDPVEQESEMYLADSVELFAGDDPAGANRYQVILGPGLDPSHPELRLWYGDKRASQETPLVIEAQRQPIPGGYFLEVRLPWKVLGIDPKVGATAAVQAYFNDKDAIGNRLRLMWFQGADRIGDQHELFPITLAEKASRTPAARANAELLEGEAALRLVGTATDKERRAEFRDGEKLVASIVIPPGADRAGALVPAGIVFQAKLTATLDGQLIMERPLETTSPMDASKIARLDYSVAPCVFAGESFPKLQLVDREAIESVAGPVKTGFRFFDADYKLTEKPTKMGRYAAELTVTFQDGSREVRYLTLFRTVEEYNRRIHTLEVSGVKFPELFGIDPTVSAEHPNSISYVLNRDFHQNYQDQRHAVLLAGLSEAKALGRPATGRESPERLDTDWWYGFRKTHGLLKPYDRMVTLPTDYAADPDKRWPLVLFLHGSGDGDSQEKLRKWGPPKEIAKGREFPFIMAAPRSPPGQWMWWNPVQVGEFLDELEREYRVDKDRIYVTGLSMGGYGAWYLANEFPERFAAIAPFCGGGEPGEAARIAKLPIWTFHGEKDAAVPVEETRKMVAALEAAGGKPKVTYYPEIGHQCWDEVYTGTELYEWLLAQKRVAR